MLTIETSKMFGNTWVRSSLTVDDEGVHVLDRGTYGMFPKDSRVPFNQIAAVHLRRGLFTSEIAVETTGGNKIVLGALKSAEAEQAVIEIRNHIARIKGTAS